MKVTFYIFTVLVALLCLSAINAKDDNDSDSAAAADEQLTNTSAEVHTHVTLKSGRKKLPSKNADNVNNVTPKTGGKKFENSYNSSGEEDVNITPKPKNDGGNRKDKNGNNNAAVMARLLINAVDWAAIGTVGSTIKMNGYTAINILGVSDGPTDNGKGVPYILMSHALTGEDILVNNKISLSVSLAQLGYCQYNNLDQQDPRCAFVNFIGNYKNLTKADKEYIYAKDALRNRHPHLENWATYYIGQLEIQYISVLEQFGGPTEVSVEDYFNVEPNEYRDILYMNTIPLLNATNRRNNKGGAVKDDVEFCPENVLDQNSQVISRFIIHHADWGSITTFAFNQSNANVADGTPFNSVASVSDGFSGSGSGVPYIYVSPLEDLVKHALNNNRVSMLLSLAGTKFCKGIDPIGELCPSVTLIGSLVEVDDDDIEYKYAEMALFSRHASMVYLPKDHHFKVNKLIIQHTQLKFKFCDQNEELTRSWKSINTYLKP